ncbi:MAG: PD-(D/E)XK nuclease family protein [Candidatus Heimdallarchaeota archaeon]|nr:PD-(D/E)XK nuclease family protein [Candidatus Heimdallarchaeota archaeon]
MVDPKWKESLKVDISTLSSEIELANEFDRVYISTLGAQLYCEKKVEFDIQYKPESTDIQKRGTEIHQALIPTEEIDIDDLIDRIDNNEEQISIFPVFFNYGEVLISGIHDGIVFRKGKPKYLFEIKTTRNLRNLEKIWPGERFQSILYAMALQQMGFDISSLKIIILKVSQDIDSASYIDKVLLALDKMQPLPENLRSLMNIHSFGLTDKRREEQTKILDNLLHYWKRMRMANGVTNRNKCKYCDYTKECHYFKIIP